MAEPLVIGLDYWADSARAALVRVRDGTELESAVLNFPRWANGEHCNPRLMQYHQHPLDFIDAAENVIVLKAADPAARYRVVGLAFDATASTPCMVDATCAPLALRSSFADNRTRCLFSGRIMSL
ncbi:hypothetical protein CUR178_00006 [Leishmania enriettii]|uniref:Uncharacterized protein n=1 Tax=Leishmania enriettii TaxID=5663 RepID=A0A836KAR4_LEIEN|nr:hypothetical protein CUR178_00006 [Leishmania enriettii]